jgi:hypothetical protein
MFSVYIYSFPKKAKARHGIAFEELHSGFLCLRLQHIAAEIREKTVKASEKRRECQSFNTFISAFLYISLLQIASSWYMACKKKYKINAK